jgi:DNA invertase Pin-like site-specific DNA recombinase
MLVTLLAIEKGFLNGKFVSYIRVSTQKQGKSGLGLDAQREAITNFLNGGRWKLVGEYREVESGKNSARPELAKALSLCRLHNATLLVAKLDRLARNVHFLSGLMEAGVKFVAADMPEANETMLHFMSVMAQHEAKAISERTKAALKAAKARGVVLGGLNTPRGGVRMSHEHWSRVTRKGRLLGAEKRTADASKWAADVLPIIEDIRQSGAVSLREIAAGLNERDIQTRRGGEWTATQVQRILARSE